MSSSSINVGQLKAFLAVLEEGGFTAAAHKLGLTQSGVSQAVAALEESLGVVLLLRNRGRVAPTAAGAAVRVVHVLAAMLYRQNAAVSPWKA